MQADVTLPPSGVGPDLTCPNPNKTTHLLKNPVTLPCCPEIIWCRTCAGLAILQNGNRCYAGCEKSVQTRDLKRCQQTIALLHALTTTGDSNNPDPDTNSNNSDSTESDSDSSESDSDSTESDSDSIHTLGSISDATGQHAEEYTRMYVEDKTGRLHPIAIHLCMC